MVAGEDEPRVSTSKQQQQTCSACAQDELGGTVGVAGDGESMRGWYAKWR